MKLYNNSSTLRKDRLKSSNAVCGQNGHKITKLIGSIFMINFGEIKIYFDILDLFLVENY